MPALLGHIFLFPDDGFHRPELHSGIFDIGSRGWFGHADTPEVRFLMRAEGPEKPFPLFLVGGNDDGRLGKPRISDDTGNASVYGGQLFENGHDRHAVGTRAAVFRVYGQAHKTQGSRLLQHFRHMNMGVPVIIESAIQGPDIVLGEFFCGFLIFFFLFR
jgi:hypothetical protein